MRIPNRTSLWIAPSSLNAVLILVLGAALALPATQSRAQISKEDLIGLGVLLLLEGQRNANPSGNSGTAPSQGAEGTNRATAPRSDLVAESQRKLNALGYDAGSVDGQMGPRTRRAIAAFQGDAGLPVTGEPSPALIEALDQSSPRMAETSAPMNNIGDAPGVVTSGANATAATLIQMAVMSDREYYRSVADAAGINYIRATGTDADCRVLYDATTRDEFARREVVTQATVQFLEVMNGLPDGPISAQIEIEATYLLGDYDFERKGYPIRLDNGSNPILRPGKVRVLNEKRPVFCVPPWGYVGDFVDMQSGYDTKFEELEAQHEGVAGIDFLPLDEVGARVFSNRSKAIQIKGQLLVEPRAQGRGPLPGRFVSLEAYLPEGGPLLHRWSLSENPDEPPASQIQTLSPGLLSAIVMPVVEPQLDNSEIDNASIQYFRRFSYEIDRGNDPPGSPLPIDAIRGKLPEVIAELNRPALRAHLAEVTQPLPVTVTITKDASIHYQEGIGLQFNTYETGLPVAPVAALSDEIPLSDRGLQLATELIAFPTSEDYTQAGYRGSAFLSAYLRPVVELDRFVTLYPVAATIEQAAERGIVSNMGNRDRDRVAVEWTLNLTEVRTAEDRVILSAELKSLIYRWTSDGRILAAFDAEDFPTMAAFRQGIEDALPPLAGAERVTPPPNGSRWDAEMSDLLQLRYASSGVDDAYFHRMMIARHFHEAGSQHMPPAWGHFFRDFEERMTPEERAARMEEFRAWTEARAEAIPENLSLILPLVDYTGGKFAPYENLGYHPHENGCRSYSNIDPETADEGQIVQSRACAYLAHAWRIPEPMLRLKLRSDCLADGYCRGLNEARAELGLDNRDLEDVILLDRLPVLTPEARQSKRPIAIELTVEPKGAEITTERRETVYEAALRRSDAFLAEYQGNRRQGDTAQKVGAPFTVFAASARSARLVDMETGEVLGSLDLAEPAPPADELLVLPDTTVTERDILGIRLGMTFDEADQVIRGHMAVSKVLTADRGKQIATLTSEIAPYTSGRLYASADGMELIAIYDEPPAASGTVLGIWRLLRLPKGSVDPQGLKTTLTARYGEPRVVQDVSLPFMETGIAWLWQDVEHPGCGPIGKSFQTDLWRDADGSTTWLPPFMMQHLYPQLDTGGFSNVKGEDNPPSSFCPAFLGAQYSSPGENGGAPAGDEVLTWLTDNRAYAEQFHASRKAIREGTALPSSADATGGVEIKF